MLPTSARKRGLEAELTHHLGYEKVDPAGCGSGNSCNGTSSKTILTEDGVPRDRAGSFEPQLIAKGQTHFDAVLEEVREWQSRPLDAVYFRALDRAERRRQILAQGCQRAEGARRSLDSKPSPQASLRLRNDPRDISFDHYQNERAKPIRR
jgi:transposase-like protein